MQTTTGRSASGQSKNAWLRLTCIGITGIVLWGSNNAAAVTKKKTKKPVTSKVTATKNSPVPAATKTLDPLVAQLGQFGQTGANNKEVLTTKWGFPSWWPNVDGEVVSVTDVRLNSGFENSTGFKRYQGVMILLDGPQNADALADKFGALNGFTRLASEKGQSTIGLPNTSVTFTSNTDTTTLRVEVMNQPSIGAKYLAELTFTSTTPEINTPPLPGQDLVSVSQSLNNPKQFSASTSVSSIRYDLVPPSWKRADQVLARFDAQYKDTANEVLQRFATTLPKTFLIYKQEPDELQAVDPRNTQVRFTNLFKGAATLEISRPVPALLTQTP
jgi:hypothetical protein